MLAEPGIPPTPVLFYRYTSTIVLSRTSWSLLDIGHTHPFRSATHWPSSQRPIPKRLHSRWLASITWSLGLLEGQQTQHFATPRHYLLSLTWASIAETCRWLLTSCYGTSHSGSTFHHRCARRFVTNQPSTAFTGLAAAIDLSACEKRFASGKILE